MCAPPHIQRVTQLRFLVLYPVLLFLCVSFLSLSLFSSYLSGRSGVDLMYSSFSPFSVRQSLATHPQVSRPSRRRIDIISRVGHKAVPLEADNVRRNWIQQEERQISMSCFSIALQQQRDILSLASVASS